MNSVVMLTPGTDEWLRYRADPDRCNASEAGAVMAVNPWSPKTPLELYKLKQGQLEVQTTPAMQRGIDGEAAALDKFSELNDLIMAPAVFERGAYSCSVDGVTADLVTAKCEIKIPMKGRESATWKKIEETGELPKNYWFQCVHQHHVCPTNRSYFFLFNPDTGDHLQLELDNAQLEAAWHELADAWESFRVSIGTNTPPAPTEKDRVTRTDDDWIQASEDLIAAQTAADAAQSRLEDAKQQIRELSDGQASAGCGVTISWYRQKGTISYKKIPQLNGVDLEQYRGKDALRCRINIDNRK